LLVITVLFVFSGSARRPALMGRIRRGGGCDCRDCSRLSLGRARTFLEQPIPGLLNTLLLCALLAVALLIYLRLLTKAHSPALAERGCRRCRRASVRTSCSTA
jgi:hypothetical protein